MQTTTIGMWEFIREPNRLTYRLTTIGLLPGALVMILLALFAATWSYQTFQKASGPASYLGGFVLSCASLACCYGLFHHLRGRLNPYVLDKNTDSFSNGYKARCSLSEVRSVEVICVKGVRGTDGPTRYSYHVEFLLQNGETTSCYLVSSTQSLAEQHAQQLRHFLQGP